MTPVRTSSRGMRTESLVDVIDTVVDGGLVVDGDVIISVAGVDLLYLDLRLLLAPVDRLLAPEAEISGDIADELASTRGGRGPHG